MAASGPSRGAAVDASGCHTAGRCTMSQPSTTSFSSSAPPKHRKVTQSGTKKGNKPSTAAMCALNERMKDAFPARWLSALERYASPPIKDD